VFVAIVIVGNGAVSGQAHSGHIPSDVDVEIFGGGIANITWVSLFTIQSGAPVTSGQEVTGMIEFIQNWSGTSSKSWEVAPATISPDFSQGDWNVTFAWWAVIPNLTSVVVGSDTTVSQSVDNGFVDVVWNTVGSGFGSESINERDFSLRCVVGVDHFFVEVDQPTFGVSSEISDRSAMGEASKCESSD